VSIPLDTFKVEHLNTKKKKEQYDHGFFPRALKPDSCLLFSFDNEFFSKKERKASHNENISWGRKQSP
jgi:hypothetical protein